MNPFTNLLNLFRRPTPSAPVPMSFADALIAAATKEVGVRESPPKSNRGPRVDTYQGATWLSKSDWGAWCAAFICFVVKQAIASVPVRFQRPQTAGAWDFERWAKTQDGHGVTLMKPPKGIKRGDLVVYKFSHIGLAVADEDGGHVKTIEGNTNDAGSREGDGVYAKTRSTELIRSVIRLTT